MDIQVKVLASSSKGNCAYITDGATPLLLDAGLPLRKIREGLNFGLSKIAAALITHSHSDHCCGVRDLIAAGIDCYMLQSTAEGLWSPLTWPGVSGHRLHVINPMERLTIGTWKILAFDTPHDVENVGFLLMSQSDRVLYLVDTPYCKYRFTGLNYILIGVDYDLALLKANVKAGLVDRELKRRVLRNHMSLDTAKAFLKANDLSKVREIVLLHLSAENSDAARFKCEIQALTGKVVRIA